MALDFMKVSTRPAKHGSVEIYPKFIITRTTDLMIRGGDFYAIWVEEKGLWSKDEHDALQLIDRELDRYAKEYTGAFEGEVRVLHMWDTDNRMITKWHTYCQKDMRDTFHPLDENLIFSNQETGKNDYASKKLPYPLQEGEPQAWNRLLGVLYSPEERHKIEWAIGAIVSGDSKKLHKFLVFYGSAGTGKSTVLNIIEKLFDGYTCTFDAKALGSSSHAFALESFRNNPLVGIQQDGDLSRIEDNTRLNSLVSHEVMTVNEKYKSTYESYFNVFLFMGTNRPVKITDSKSGLIRRLIDVSPTGEKIPPGEYRILTKQVLFELGMIASRCHAIYRENPDFYEDYIPVRMMGATNDFYNFVMDNWSIFKRDDETTLKAAWEMYKNYCDDAKVTYPYPKRAFSEELKNYFRSYSERITLPDGSRVRSYYSGFKFEKFEQDISAAAEPERTNLLKLDCTESLLDKICADCAAQYASDAGTPGRKWANVLTKLRDIDTSQLHYVKVPDNHIVIDFDICDSEGNKLFERNLEEASKWPPTYAEVSKSGKGIHLHYIYSGNADELSRVYDDKIEVKVFTGNSSLRRQLTRCNNLPIATISSGLPKKEGKMVIFDRIQSEKGLRTLIKRNLNKEIHDATKPSVDFIYKILEDAYNSDLKYDVSDLQGAIFSFAAGSTHQSEACVKLVAKMKFKSKEELVSVDEKEEAELVFYDVEVFPNLLLVNWKIRGKDKPVIRLINPTSMDIESMLKYRLIGFNNRSYDNHILYARLMGYDNDQIYNLSQKLVHKDKNISRSASFGDAFNLSYADVYDFSTKKQSLKKFEIELGIHHQELGLPWDEPVPEEKWPKVAEYCDNDVIATEAVFDARHSDFVARQILATIANMTVNDTTNSLTTRIIFGSNRRPQDQFNYRDLALPVRP